MPAELIAEAPGRAVLLDYEDREVAPGEIRIWTQFSSVKHGTEFRKFRGDSSDMHDRWDWNFRLHRRGDLAVDTFPCSLGNMAIGVVEEVGSQVNLYGIGDRVFGHLPVRETHTVEPDRVRPVPTGLSDPGLMYWDPADFAVGGIRDGNVRLGDRVAVFGLGAIGQMSVQAAQIAGARWVAAVDPVRRRREGAQRHGADVVLDPTEVDAGVSIKESTEGVGVDVALEASGSSSALLDALRCVKYSGTIVSTAYYIGPMDGLQLSGEWHRNRIRIVSSRACSEPLPDFGWDFDRIRSESFALLAEDRLVADDLIDPVVPFDKAAEAYMTAVQNPEYSIKLGIKHSK